MGGRKDGCDSMKQYWVSAIVQNKGDKRAWLCAMSSMSISIEDGMKTIERLRNNFTVLSAWIDMIDEDDVKQTVFHECYVNELGYVKKDN